uniref:Odorant receptor n=1 Tax=Colaphellus bowringi TaxID=561076 RepID=A0A0S3J3H8_9CUCU|nr:odorant receptor OR34 [Colaphellus bowringi]
MTFFFKIKGLSPPKTTAVKIIYLSLALPHILMCTFVLILSEWMAFALSQQTFKERMFNMSVATLDTILVFRTTVWAFNKAKLDEIRAIITRKSFNFRCFDLLKVGCEQVLTVGRTKEVEKERGLSCKEIKQLWQKAKFVTEKKCNEMDVFRKELMLNTRLLCCFIHLAITIISVLTYTLSFVNDFTNDTYEAYNPILNRTSLYRKFQYPLYLPFDTSFDGYYWLAYFYNCYAHLGNIITFLPIETTLTCSLIHLISQTAVLKEAFKYVDENNFGYQSFGEASIIKEIRIVKCINEIQEIYRAVELLENLCNVQLMVQYGFATFLLCSICYVIPLVENTMEGICCLIFFAASLGQIFTFSYCCHTLALELQAIGVSVYNLDWTNYPSKLKRTLNISILRTQKPANLTAGKIIVIDLLFFIQVVQKSYSFYTLITKTN